MEAVVFLSAKYHRPDLELAIERVIENNNLEDAARKILALLGIGGTSPAPAPVNPPPVPPQSAPATPNGSAEASVTGTI